MTKHPASPSGTAFDGIPADLLKRFRARFDPAQVKPGTFADPNDVVLFVHLPKTAGMSVGRSLQGAFEKFYGIAWQDTARSFRKATREACYLRTHTPCRQILMGHYSWTELSTWVSAEMPVKGATIIRNPVARVISNYNYNCSAKHPARDQFRSRHPTVENFIHSLPTDFQLTKMIGSFYSFEHALEKLLKYYSFIGITEALAASLGHFSASHGLPMLQEHHINLGERVEAAQISSSVVKLIEQRNHNDLRFHRLMSSIFGGEQ